MVWPARVVKLANFARSNAQVVVSQSELAQEKTIRELHSWCGHLNRYVDSLQFILPLFVEHLTLGSFFVRLVKRPEVMALGSTFLHDIACRHDQCHILLCDHSP